MLNFSSFSSGYRRENGSMLNEIIRIMLGLGLGTFSIYIGMAIGHALKKEGISPTKVVDLSTKEAREQWYKALEIAKAVFQSLQCIFWGIWFLTGTFPLN
jgi:hypothetical protein